MIMAYGQTGAGKTHTILGGASWNERGLLPRFLKVIFVFNSENSCGLVVHSK